MITHIVMWSFKDEAAGNSKQVNIETFKRMLEGLVGVISEIQYFEVGLKTEKSPADNQEMVLISKFKSWEDLKAYAMHPEHQKVVAFAKEVVLARSVIDFES